MSESNFIKRIHSKLPKEIFVWKISDRFHYGVPDAYYSGPKGDLWIEYKWDSGKPTDHQLNWLKGRWQEGRKIYLVKGTKRGVGIFPGDFSQETTTDEKGLIDFIKQHTL